MNSLFQCAFINRIKIHPEDKDIILNKEYCKPSKEELW